MTHQITARVRHITEPTLDHVHVRVINGLAGRRTAIDANIYPINPTRRGHLPDDLLDERE